MKVSELVAQMNDEGESLISIKTAEMTSDEKKNAAILLEQLAKTQNEIYRLAQPVAQLTFSNDKNSKKSFYIYNNTMLVKYCHLLDGRLCLIAENHYFPAIIIERSMFEIIHYIRYFYKNPTKMAAFLKNERKFKPKQMIEDCLPNLDDGEYDYPYYRWLCSISHPSSTIFLNLYASKMKTENGQAQIQTIYGSSFDKDGFLTKLVSLLNDNRALIEIEYFILKDNPLFKRNDKLLAETAEITKKYAAKTFWNQEGVKRIYNKAKEKRIKALNSTNSKLL